MELTLEEFLGKKYKLKSSENFEEYLKFIEVGMLSRKTACAVSPISVLTRDDDVYTFTMITTFRTVIFKFKFGEEFIEERPDGCKLKATVTMDGNTLVHTQIESNGRKSVHRRTFTPETLTVETTAEGWDNKCIRIYEAVP
ncbi:unnamed protein product [Arctia plantaginis]|uniref:Cytosolic fatty-acid binding proteins domain-containing protein n=1 Tax=Arctia plantaginis TaxID=874455 RepID=A0A8S1AKW4_ARCPL|nr:unnamed protein product [Arctia plantaginis]